MQFMGLLQRKKIPMIDLLINADDLLLAPSIDSAIVDLLENNEISNTTALMCLDHSADNLMALSKQLSTRNVGVHLQLSSGAPLLSKNVPSLLNQETGTFLGPHHFLTSDANEVFAEWNAQVALFISVIGHLPSHIDSHHGPHRLKHLLPVYVALSRKYGIPVRAGGGISPFLSKYNVPHPCGYVDGWTGTNGTYECLWRLIVEEAKVCESTTVEVVIHPSTYDENLREISSLNDQRFIDYKEIKSLHKWSQEQNRDTFRLVNFGKFL